MERNSFVRSKKQYNLNEDVDTEAVCNNEESVKSEKHIEAIIKMLKTTKLRRNKLSIQIVITILNKSLITKKCLAIRRLE